MNKPTSRRSFLLGTSAIAITAAMPGVSQSHGHILTMSEADILAILQRMWAKELSADLEAAFHDAVVYGVGVTRDDQRLVMP
jgi:hypothetical protein